MLPFVLAPPRGGQFSLTLLQGNILVRSLGQSVSTKGMDWRTRDDLLEAGSRNAGLTSCYRTELAGSIRPFGCEFSSVDWLSSDPEPGGCPSAAGTERADRPHL